MRIMVMDGQGGGVGRSLLEALKERFFMYVMMI